MKYEKIGGVLAIIAFEVIIIAVLLCIVVSSVKDEKSIDERNYPVIYYRYSKTQGILSDTEKVEVIYETDNEMVKESYFVSSIKIGKKTEVVKDKKKCSFCYHSKLYMTKDDYESLFSEKPNKYNKRKEVKEYD